jgi:3-phenylpropionate/trans-cinnamate dioxygenase ferredoxin subunit
VADGAELRICATADVPDGEARRFDHDGLRLCVVHLGDDWYAIGDECTHADYSLSEGTIWPDEREIECPKHGSAFSLETGDPQTLPAVVPVPTYEVRVDGDDVLVTRTVNA